MNKYTLLLSLLLLSVCSMAQFDSSYSPNGGSVIHEVPKIRCENPNNNNEIFKTVEQMPSFPGGQEEMMKFIANNCVYPDSVQELVLQGRGMARFVVEIDGSLSDITIIRGIDRNLDREFMKLIRSMPKWIPGKQNGEAVRVYFTLPMSICFKQ